jgi:1-deoxy-D-xylulose-5-phosphate reductoisomerase
MPAVLNAANEEAVALFLRRRIPFTDIARLIDLAMTEHEPRCMDSPDLEEILQADRWARGFIADRSLGILTDRRAEPDRLALN